MKHAHLTSQIINAFYHVYNTLGYGFLERVYENALCIELGKRGLHCTAQHPITVHYEGTPVGKYYADVIVENDVIVELKAAESIVEAHECQLVNYLKATDIEVGLLLNFGRSPVFKRKIFSN